MLNARFLEYFRCPNDYLDSQAADSASLEASANNYLNEDYASQYRPDVQRHGLGSLVNSVYYLVRPLLGVALRKHLQRVRLRGWEKITFPAWPLDTSVDNLYREFMGELVRRSGAPVPFIWFWPDGASSCALLTHDVEAQAGYDFTPTLMDLDDSYGFKSSFQVVPEIRYQVTNDYLRDIKTRGFEVNVHDLNHDGNLFRDQETFNARSGAIRMYAAKFGARGFRSGALYRNLDWIARLGFDYDMSVPNTARLDPQRGGCCTVMPYMFADTLELPTTMLQDYTIFHMLRERTIRLWESQLDLLMKNNGLGNFIVHPDYILNDAERDLYKQLLQTLQKLSRDKGMWVALPSEVNGWWRARAQMQIVRDNGRWTIRGAQNDRARLAFASIRNGNVEYEFASSQTPGMAHSAD